MEHYEIRKQSISDLTINNHKHAYAVVKFFSSVKLDIFAKSQISLAMAHSSYRYELSIENVDFVLWNRY